VEVYELYLKGRLYLNKRTEASLSDSIPIFEQVLSIEPLNAPAHAALAECYFLLGLFGFVEPSLAMPKAKNAASRALAINDSLADAHVVLGSVRGRYEWDWEGADRAFRKALELSPGNAVARSSYAFRCLMPLGRTSEAIEELNQAVQLDPLSVTINMALAITLYSARRYQEAVQQCAQVNKLDACFARAHSLKALALAFQGAYQEAIRASRKGVELGQGTLDFLNQAALACVLAMAGHRRPALARILELERAIKQKAGSPFWLAMAYTRLGAKGEALSRLELAFERRDPWLVSMGLEPLADPLRNEPRYHSLIRRMGLPDFPPSNLLAPAGTGKTVK
jgi:tetratricopeptide (TPR) repeat protein